MQKTNAQAEIVAIKALDWLVGNEELLMTFMGSSGAGIDDLKTGAKDPAFLGSILDFILMDDTWVQEFCDAINLPYDQPYIVRQSLPGGDIPNWT